MSNYKYCNFISWGYVEGCNTLKQALDKINNEGGTIVKIIKRAPECPQEDMGTEYTIIYSI